MSHNDEHLSLHQVAEELGVHYMTAYRYVRIGMLPARKEGKTWRVLRSDLEAMRSEPKPPVERGGAPWPPRLASRLIAGDEAGAWSVIESALAAGAAPGDVVSNIITPAMHEIGDRWQRGEIGVDAEHTASGICARLLPRLGSRFVRRGISKGSVVVGTTATDLHSLPVAVVAELMRTNGYDVVDLGSYLPATDFANAAASAPRLVAVGVGVTMHDPVALAETVAALRDAVDVPIFVGGSGATEEATLAAGADGWASDGPSFAELVAAL